MAQWWYYSGQVTTSVKGVEMVLDSKRGRIVHVNDAPDNARVIKPRTRFAAPMGSVGHLVRVKKIKAIRPPKEARLEALAAKKEASVAAKPAPVATKSPEAPKPVASSRDATGEEPVVASPVVEPEPAPEPKEAPDSVTESTGEAGEGEPHSSSSEPSEEKSKPRRKRRRGGS